MNDDTNWNALREQRQAFVERVRALAVDAAWQEVRSAMEASPPLHPDEPVPTVYEGPNRSFLLPLPYELLQDFMTHRSTQALDIIFEHTADANPLVAAYCLRALSNAADPRLVEAVARFDCRQERIEATYGCFAWEGTLAEYGKMLLDEYLKSREENQNER